jgi:hypothetical protein
MWVMRYNISGSWGKLGHHGQNGQACWRDGLAVACAALLWTLHRGLCRHVSVGNELGGESTKVSAKRTDPDGTGNEGAGPTEKRWVGSAERYHEKEGRGLPAPKTAYSFSRSDEGDGCDTIRLLECRHDIVLVRESWRIVR